MIGRPEIEEMSNELSVSIPSIERDYAVGWFLFGIFTTSQFKSEYFLKGGNAFRKGYYTNARYSVDIDLGIQREISEESLRQDLEKVCAFVTENAGIDFNTESTKIKEKFGNFDAEDRWKVFQVQIPFQDFYSNADHLTVTIRMDVTRLDKYMLPLQQRPLLHPYSDSDEFAGVQIQCLKLEELMANKLKCLLQREHVADMYDFVFGLVLNQSLNIDRSEMLNTFLRKTIFVNNPGVAKGILSSTPMDFFREQWDKGLRCAKDILIDADTAIGHFQRTLDELFSPYPARAWNDEAFFPASARHSIIRAGRTQTLLKMEYDGVVRMIEPYSMKYKESRAGMTREYLYVYDRTGSKNNPGVKSFLPPKMGRVENTEEKFPLREDFEMELSKAGEPIEDRLLYDPTRPHKVPTRSRLASGLRSAARLPRRSAFGGMKYRYKCTVCGKIFTKRTMDSTLGRHKNKNSQYDCYGSFGQYLGSSY